MGGVGVVGPRHFGLVLGFAALDCIAKLGGVADRVDHAELVVDRRGDDRF